LDEIEVHDYLRTLVEATDIGIVLYAVPHKGRTGFHPSGVALNALNKLASLPSACALKLTQTTILGNPISTDRPVLYLWGAKTQESKS